MTKKIINENQFIEKLNAICPSHILALRFDKTTKEVREFTYRRFLKTENFLSDVFDELSGNNGDFLKFIRCFAFSENNDGLCYESAAIPATLDFIFMELEDLRLKLIPFDDVNDLDNLNEFKETLYDETHFLFKELLNLFRLRFEDCEIDDLNTIKTFQRLLRAEGYFYEGEDYDGYADAVDKFTEPSLLKELMFIQNNNGILARDS